MRLASTMVGGTGLAVALTALSQLW